MCPKSDKMSHQETSPTRQNHSVLSAITGSFLEAAFAGIKPPIKVSIMLNATNIAAFVKYKVTFKGMFPVK